MKTRGVSVRSSGDVLWVQIYCDGRKTFKGSAPLNDKRKLASLFSALKVKGVDLPKDAWW